ncbi:unnamed protein product [Phytophthora lilii]|uniref:Unnamed protein product n=1 Tax=Phytophthora lilii TaxID=2077276 RepID=A0A9W6TH97_9STRA|nr:unnamed protein product [Phytophthora lilii]
MLAYQTPLPAPEVVTTPVTPPSAHHGLTDSLRFVVRLSTELASWLYAMGTGEREVSRHLPPLVMNTAFAILPVGAQAVKKTTFQADGDPSNRFSLAE